MRILLLVAAALIAGCPGKGATGPYTPGGFAGDLAFAAAGAGEASASWLFGNLKPGTYRVSATWVPHPNRATNAPFTILDGASMVGQVKVDQRQAPVSRTSLGADWQDLGSSHTITGDALTVRLTNNADGYVIADAVQIEQLKPGPPSCR